MKTIHHDMIEILRRGLNACGPRAGEILDYIASLQNPDGGFRGRTVQSDLYYTVFAADILSVIGLDSKRESLIQYVNAEEIKNLDCVHLCCWIRCAAGLNILNGSLKQNLMRQLKQYLCTDGLYHHIAPGQDASIYGTFMVFSAAQDLNETIIEPATLISKLGKFKHPNGSYKNEFGQGAGTLPPTAAVIVMQAQLGAPVEKQTVDWIFSCLTDEGGFAVSPRMPVADLLSTATALQALRQADVDVTSIKQQCHDYVAALIQNSGGFCANTFDSTVDAEYTFYGLLAMGNLIEASTI